MRFGLISYRQWTTNVMFTGCDQILLTRYDTTAAGFQEELENELLCLTADELTPYVNSDICDFEVYLLVYTMLCDYEFWFTDSP
jgi:hypothetical protein